jgi:hypothetical protein
MQKDEQWVMAGGLDGWYRIEADALAGAVRALVVGHAFSSQQVV